MSDMLRLPALQTVLVDLRLDRVDLVHTGSNTRADILLTKGKEQNAMTKFEELFGKLNPEQQAVVKAQMESIEKSKEAEVTALTEKVEALEKAKPTTDPAPATGTEEDVLKGASPAVVEMVKKMREDMTAMMDRESEAIAKARFESCKAIPCDETELKTVLKTASPAVVEILKKASEAIEKGLCTATGTEAAGEFQAVDVDAQYAVLEKSAKEIMQKDACTFETAFTKACEANPDVYAKYVKGVRD